MTPNRMCAVCRERREKRELVRIVKSGDGKVQIDIHGKLSGRGAYICRDGECIQNAARRRALERSFNCSIDADIYKELFQIGTNNDNKDR